MKKSIIYTLSVLILLGLGSCNKTASDKMTSKNDVPKLDETAINAWRSTVPSAGPARKISIGDYQSFDLDNGLKVIVVENHKLPRVSYQLSLNNDPILEKEEAGYVSMAGQLMKTGTATKTKAEIDEAIDFIGANITTSGSGMFASSLKKHEGKLLDLMTEILYSPSFPESEFEKLKTQTLSGLATVKTDPNSMAGNVASALLYGKDHPYGEVETERTVNNITIDKCKGYYDLFFRPNNAYLVVVGDITPEEAKETVNKYFGSWESKKNPAYVYESKELPKGTQVAFVNKDAAVQSVIRVTYPVDLKPGADDAIAASLMNSILGGGIFSGRLMQNLREDKAYTYGARSSLSSDKLVGNFNAFASVRNEVTDSSVVEFLYELNRMRDERVNEDDLQLAKNSRAGQFARSLESPQTIARFALNTFRYNLPKDYYNTYLERLESVTVDDIMAAAQKYITPDNAYIVVAGNKDEVADKLKRFDSDGEISYFDAFGNTLEDMSDAMPEGVTAETVVADYINALGGQEALQGVKTRMQKMSSTIMGQAASMTIKQKLPGKFAMKMEMSGMVLQEQIFDGAKMKSGQMGQSKVITEGEELEKMKEQAKMFSVLDYSSGDYKTELKGMEDVDGQKAYKLSVTDPRGDKTTEFYNIESNLLIRTVSVMEAQGQTVTQTTDFKDYKEVDGIMIPHTMVVSGAMPMPITMTTEMVEINKTINDDVFKVE